MRAMYSMDKTPSDITEPVGEASEPTVPTQALAAHTPADSETNSPDTAGPSSERLKNLLGCRPKLAALIGWYVGLLQEKSILHQRMGQNLMSLSVHPIAGAALLSKLSGPPPHYPAQLSTSFRPSLPTTFIAQIARSTISAWSQQVEVVDRFGARADLSRQLQIEGTLYFTAANSSRPPLSDGQPHHRPASH